MKKIEKAYSRIKSALSEAEGGLTILKSEGRLLIEISTGRNFSLSKKEINYQAAEFDRELAESNEINEKTPLTAELLETYNFKKTRNQTDHDDVGYDYHLPHITMIGHFQINGEPCEIDALEGEYYTDEGEAHNLYIRAIGCFVEIE